MYVCAPANPVLLSLAPEFIYEHFYKVLCE
jgi:hypothetical protein